MRTYYIGYAYLLHTLAAPCGWEVSPVRELSIVLLRKPGIDNADLVERLKVDGRVRISHASVDGETYRVRSAGPHGRLQPVGSRETEAADLAQPCLRRPLKSPLLRRHRAGSCAQREDHTGRLGELDAVWYAPSWATPACPKKSA